jgi:hypothetical protein
VHWGDAGGGLAGGAGSRTCACAGARACGGGCAGPQTGGNKHSPCLRCAIRDQPPHCACGEEGGWGTKLLIMLELETERGVWERQLPDGNDGCPGSVCAKPSK